MSVILHIAVVFLAVVPLGVVLFVSAFVVERKRPDAPQVRGCAYLNLYGHVVTRRSRSLSRDESIAVAKWILDVYKDDGAEDPVAMGYRVAKQILLDKGYTPR